MPRLYSAEPLAKTAKRLLASLEGKSGHINLLIIVFLLSGASLTAQHFPERFQRSTPQQTEQYWADKASNPERYTYNPLQVDNKWFYSGYYEDFDGYHDIPHFCGREVSADSLIDGVMHYWVFSNYTFEDGWECNQGDSMLVWTHDPYHDPPDFDALRWVFTPGATFVPYGFGNWEMTCEPNGLIEVYGQTVMSVIFNLVPSNPVLWTEVFGPVATMFDFGELYLDGCIIDGVSYGNTPVDDELVPAVTELSLSCNPNPFRETANISFSLEDKGKATLAVYNLRGQKVRTLLSGELPSGKHQLAWDGRDDRGQQAASGIYFLRLEQGGHNAVRKMVLMD